MPWLVANYEKRIMKIGKDELMTKVNQNMQEARVTNLRVKKFRSILREKSALIHVFQLVPVKKYETRKGFKENYTNPGLKELLEKYETVFQDELPSGLPPQRKIDQKLRQRRTLSQHTGLYISSLQLS